MNKTKGNKYQSISIHKYLLMSVISLVIFFGLVQETEAANHYIRAGAAGSSPCTAGWGDNQACNTLPESLTRGDTYYIANGNYSGYTFDDSGTSIITIKKATSEDHGTSTGWNSEYGVGQTIFGTTGSYGAYFTSGYYLIDGQTGGGPNGWTSNLGIKLNKVYITGSGAPKVYSIELRHCDIDGGTTTSNGSRPIYTNNTSGITISYCYVHHAGDDMWTMVATSNVLVEYSKWAFAYESVNYHPDLAQAYGGPYSNLIWRYNYIYDVDATYLWGVHDRNTATNYEIYGNIIVFTSRSNTSDGIVGDLNGNGTINNLKFYNNTITGDFNFNVGFGPISGSNNVAYNNLWVKLSGTGFGSIDSVIHDYNSFYNFTHSGEENRSGDPFTNSANNIYTLSGPTDAGISLPSPYNVDMFGNTRGADDVWDRGAYEYVSGPSSCGDGACNGAETCSNCLEDCGDCTLTPPANLTATAVSSSQINLTWAANTEPELSGYRIYRCQGTDCTPTTQIGTSPTNSYQNTELSPSTTYVYRVKAYDTTGGESDYSTPASATTEPFSGTFAIGDRVEVIADPSLRVRSSAGTSDATILGTQPKGARGTVIGGPVSADGYTWWEIDYEASPDGWSIEGSSQTSYLAQVISDTTPPAAPTGLTVN